MELMEPQVRLALRVHKGRRAHKVLLDLMVQMAVMALRRLLPLGR